MKQLKTAKPLEIKGKDIVTEFVDTVPVLYKQIGEEYIRRTITIQFFCADYLYRVLDAVKKLFPNVDINDIEAEHIVRAEMWVVGNDLWQEMQINGKTQAIVDDNSSIVMWEEDGYNYYRIEYFAFIDKEDETHDK
jgi:hypothetical protein